MATGHPANHSRESTPAPPLRGTTAAAHQGIVVQVEAVGRGKNVYFSLANVPHTFCLLSDRPNFEEMARVLYFAAANDWVLTAEESEPPVHESEGAVFKYVARIYATRS